MSKIIALIGASAVTLAVTAGHAEAKRVWYEINGQRYWYSTNNRQQVEEARQRIEAANAAQTAQEKAKAEAAANPLVKIFGSQTQRQAVEAQAQVTALTADAAAEPEATDAVPRSRSQAHRGHAKAEAGTEQSTVEKPEQTSRDERRQRQALASAEAEMPVQPAAAEAAPASSSPGPSIKSVSFDLATGIKTVQMTDGSMHEEPFDGSMLSKLGSLEPSVNDLLAGFLNVVRKPAVEDVTGATGSPSGVRPGASPSTKN